MSTKFQLILTTVATLAIGSLTLVSCGEGNSQEFRQNPEASVTGGDSDKKVERPATKKTDKKEEEEQTYDGPITTYEANEELHDYGLVGNGSKNPFTFVLTNTGKEPLIIEKAKGSCSCTVPDWPKDPIMPGQTGEIEVTFKPKVSQAGKDVTQVVTITANTEPRQTRLKIKAKVQPSEEEEAK
ncbi:MAG: DUF1573 domain-containing protein [Flavobacteriales bacterium]